MQQALVEYILNALWQLPLLAGGAWLLVRVVEASPRVQHLLWLAVLATALLLPLAGMGSGNRVRPSLPESTTVKATAFAHPLSRPVAGEPPLRWHSGPLSRTVYVRADYGRWLVRLYLGSVVLGLLRLARAWRRSRSLVANAQITPHYREALANACQRMGVRLPCLRESAEILSPMVVGAVNPVLLLPQGFERFTDEEIRAALCHELAHIERRDSLVNAICQVAALPLLWHPVMETIEQRIHMTREMICDGMAASGLESKIGYARCLLTLAHSMLASPGAAGEAQVLNLLGKHSLEERMTRLTETTTVTVRRQTARIAAGATMMIAAGLIAAILHVTPTMAQASAPPPPIENSSAVPAGAAATLPEGRKASPRTRAQTAARREVAQQQAAKMGLLFDNAQFKQQMEDARRQAATAKALIESPQFKLQIEDARRQASAAKDFIDSPDFKLQMEDARRQADTARAFIDSPDFKLQMEDARRQDDTAKALIDSSEFKLQIEDARRQASTAKALIESPQFKQQIEDAKRQATTAKALIDSPQFKHQMEEVRRQASRAQAILDDPGFKRQME